MVVGQVEEEWDLGECKQLAESKLWEEKQEKSGLWER